jgi:hypothetical protein
MRAGDLPVQQSTKFDLVINLTNAHQVQFSALSMPTLRRRE